MPVARRYSEERKYELPDAATTVRAEALARRVLTDTFGPLLNGVRSYISMTTAEGYKSTGDDWETVLAELTTDGLTPVRTYVALYSTAPGNAVSQPPEITSYPVRCIVNVDVSSEDEGVVRATTAKLDRLMAPLIAGHEVVDADSPAPAALPSPSAEVSSDTAAAAAPSVPPAAPSFWSWLGSTWRDHTAVFLVTVVGTVVAAVFIAAFNIGG